LALLPEPQAAAQPEPQAAPEPEEISSPAEEAAGAAAQTETDSAEQAVAQTPAARHPHPPTAMPHPAANSRSTGSAKQKW